MQKKPKKKHKPVQQTNRAGGKWEVKTGKRLYLGKLRIKCKHANNTWKRKAAVMRLFDRGYTYGDQWLSD